MKKSKIISLLLMMSMFAFLMETEKQVRKKIIAFNDKLVSVFLEETDLHLNDTTESFDHLMISESMPPISEH